MLPIYVDALRANKSMANGECSKFDISIALKLVYKWGIFSIGFVSITPKSLYVCRKRSPSNIPP
jgi:hypothetical protein